jgi:hypothetical protein
LWERYGWLFATRGRDNAAGLKQAAACSGSAPVEITLDRWERQRRTALSFSYFCMHCMHYFA